MLNGDSCITSEDSYILAANIERLSAILSRSDNIVFFGGAGVSTESGIADFRSAGGLYDDTRNATYATPPEKMLSRSFFYDHTEEFYRYYKERILHLDAAPNPAHIKLAELERSGRLRVVVTQNIDGLHQKAGTVNVIELHGSVFRNNCLDCGKQYDARYIAEADGVPVCGCGGVIKPDVVLYEESLDQGSIYRAINYIADADVLIIGGTSLAVYPAAGLVQNYRGDKLVVINKSETSSDDGALLVIRQGIGEVLGKVAV